MMYRVGLLLGVLAILALVGPAGVLPPSMAFFAGTLAIILFPGFAVTELIGASCLEQDTAAEKLVLWFVMGTGAMAVTGYAGLLLRLRLSDLIVGLACGYAVLTILMLLKRTSRWGRRSPGAGTLAAIPEKKVGPGIYFGLASLAIGSGLLTLITARDYDDWYYLAYIRDFVANKPLGLEDGIFGMGAPASARVWFGGGWWVIEAISSRVSGLDPITCHQVYLPVVLAPLAVLACFALSRQLFRSHGAALMACSLQVLFLLFTPMGASLTAALMTWRMVFRLSWPLPWGLIIAFFIFRMKLRPIAA